MNTLTPLHPALLLAMLLVGAFCAVWFPNVRAIQDWFNR
jgi:hypothetical protein